MQLQTTFYFIYGLTAAAFVLNSKAVAFLLLNVVFAIVIHRAKRVYLCYATFAALLYLIHKDPVFALKKSLFGDDTHRTFLFEVAVAWLNAKCLSFSIDRIRNAPNRCSLNDYRLILAYCFYFPPFFTGPIYLYDDFVQVNLHSIREYEF